MRLFLCLLWLSRGVITAPAPRTRLAEHRTARIVVVQDREALQKLLTVCGVTSRSRATNDSQLTGDIYMPALEGRGALNDCHTLSIECKRIFSTVIFGIAGLFTPSELEKTYACLGPGYIKYHEADGKVSKAEHIADMAQGGRKIMAEPQERISDSTFTVDGSAKSVPQDRFQWLWTHVGQTAQKFIQQSFDLVREQDGAFSFFFTPAVVRSPGGDGPPLGSVTLPMTSAQDQTQMADIANAVAQPVPKVQQLASALWNLDRIDQVVSPLDGLYHYGSPQTPGTGSGVTIYSLDSGVRGSHQEFLSWSADGSASTSRVSYGYDFIDNRDGSASDCDGHGTHVASTAVGRSVGVAKDAKVVAVRVLDCDGSGTISDSVAGLDWIARRRAVHSPPPGVIIMSLGVPSGSWSKSLADAVAGMTKSGVTVVVASGNTKSDSCHVVPANIPETITVAASNMVNKFGGAGAKGEDTIYSYSNTGSCVDLFAPGVEIYGACGGSRRCQALSDTSYTWASGTSMAAPHVAGLAAIFLSLYPQASPKMVSDAIKESATQGVIDGSGILLPGTPNRLIYTLSVQSSVQASG